MRYIEGICIAVAVFCANFSVEGADSSTSISLSFTVPVVCSVERGRPKCNLELVKIGDGEWVDYERGYKVYIKGGILSIESLK